MEYEIQQLVDLLGISRLQAYRQIKDRAIIARHPRPAYRDMRK